jgi:hypothetical protein
VNFTKFVYSPATSVTPYFDDPTSLASFVSLASPPVNASPVTVTSEQAVIAYDQANPRQPLAARYPASGNSALGSPDLDYPYVLTTSVPDRLAAANLFGQYLRKPYAQEMIWYFGFRSGTGIPDSVPSSFGLATQLLQPALPTPHRSAWVSSPTRRTWGCGSSPRTCMTRGRTSRWFRSDRWTAALA